ncbi:MAG: translation initiation factor IF-2 [Spirochaetales bacterium]|nr:translation initiation factor IF-2 [Spirochaetales bacterium]
MAEEQEKTNKPKSTLIKHRKPAPPPEKSVEPIEKKKVVVVKKKVVVKKTVHKVVARKDASKSVDKKHVSVSSDNNDKKSSVKTDNIKTEAPITKASTSSVDKPALKTDSQPKKRNVDSRPPYQGNRQGVRPPYQGDRQGARPPYQGDRQGARPPYQGDRQGARPPYQGDRQGGRPPYQGDRQGGRPPYQGDRQGVRPPYQGNNQGVRPPYQGNNQGGRPPYQGNNQGGRPPYQGDRQGGRPPYQGDRQGGRPPYQSGRPGGAPGGRPPYQGGRPPYQGGRPGGAQGGRPPFQRGPQTNRAGGSSPSASEDLQKKPAGKKFFKAKKKSSYQKNKKQEVQQKNYPFKKKTIVMSNPVPKSIDIMDFITVSDLAKKMNLKASELISKLMGMGMMVTINQQIDAETAGIISKEYDCTVNIVSLYDETIIETAKENESDLEERPPIVTVMGHVDHGKTKLLDAIREADVVAGEHGGITQHIGAYKVQLKQGEVVFLDTPGHEAFTLMRARGANITDIVVLVVAANDGVMPQTIEAIHHAKEANVPIIVAVNKVDLPEANIDKVKQQLSEYDLMPEDWGGSTLFCEVSALKKQGIENLLDTIMLQKELLELKVNYNCRAEGKVVESKVDHGRGIVSTVIIERGTLKVGDSFVAGVYPGKVRAMFNDHEERIDLATPATPVEILGFSGIPDAGSPFQVTESEKQARMVGEKRQELERLGEAKNVKKITLDNIYDSIQEGEVQELKVIIKGDVHGSVEALKTAMEKLSTPEIKLNVIHAAAGAIIENDVNLASASKAIIVGFHVRPTPKATMLADQEKVEIRKYTIIYDALEDIKSAMEGLLSPELKEVTIGTIEVRSTFKVPKIGLIAGCYVLTGKVTRGSTVHVIRDGIELHTGKITSLKRFKDDAKEVEKGYECGIGIENFTDLKEGDTFEAFEIQKIARKLK